METTSREMEQLFAGLDAREQREVLEYAKALKEGALDEDPDQVHLMGSISRKDLRMVKESLEDEGLIGVLVLRFLGAFSVSDDDEEGDEAAGVGAAADGPDGGGTDGGGTDDEADRDGTDGDEAVEEEAELEEAAA